MNEVGGAKDYQDAERRGEIRVLKHIASEEFDVSAPMGVSQDFRDGIFKGIEAVRYFAQQRLDMMLGNTHREALPNPTSPDLAEPTDAKLTPKDGEGNE